MPSIYLIIRAPKKLFLKTYRKIPALLPWQLIWSLAEEVLSKQCRAGRQNRDSADFACTDAARAQGGNAETQDVVRDWLIARLLAACLETPDF